MYFFINENLIHNREVMLDAIEGIRVVEGLAEFERIVVSELR